MKHLVFFLLLTFYFLNGNSQTIIYVNANATGSNNGSSWVNAYTDLQNALLSASSNSELWVAQGTYKPDQGSNSIHPTFNLRNTVAIYGGFIGTETNRNQRNVVTNICLLTNVSSTNCSVTAKDTSAVVSSYSNNNTAILDGFTIENGFSCYEGGGMYTKNSDLIIRNVIFRNNTSGNLAGALSIRNGSIVLENCTFDNNFSPEYGGAIYNSSGSLTITNCLFESNTSQGSQGQGGAIYNSVGPLNVTNCTFKSNHASAFAGAIRNANGDLTILNSKFYDNDANSDGGAIWSLGGINKITNCIFAFNQGDDGGAIYNYGSGDLRLTNCSLFGNQANVGAGINNRDGGAKITNCIIWNNEDLSGTSLQAQIKDGTGTASLIKNSIVEGISTATNNNINSDPQFTSPFSYVFKIAATSPAIDKGLNNILGFTMPTTDIEGENRILNNTIDIGAYEFNSLTAIYKDSKKVSCNIYPNPVKDVLEIHTSFAVESIKVYDFTGKLVGTTNDTTVNFGTLPIGIYTMAISIDGQMVYKKVIKE